MEATGMTQDIVDKLQEKAKVLTGERRKRSKVVPEELATADNIRSFKTLASHPGLHSASTPGILSVDINANNTSKILTGGNQINEDFKCVKSGKIRIQLEFTNKRLSIFNH